jgi:hypothetical protein
MATGRCVTIIRIGRQDLSVKCAWITIEDININIMHLIRSSMSREFLNMQLVLIIHLHYLICVDSDRDINQRQTIQSLKT